MGIERKVRCVETGEVFESLTKAGLSIGQSYPRSDRKGGNMHHSNISHVANKHKGAKTAGGYRWVRRRRRARPVRIRGSRTPISLLFVDRDPKHGGGRHPRERKTKSTITAMSENIVEK